MSGFSEAQLEEAIIELLGEQGYPHVLGESIERGPEEVLIKDDLRENLRERYAGDGIAFKDFHKFDRKTDPKKLQFGSKKQPTQ